MKTTAKDKILFLKDKIIEISKQDISIMEVCGTHTMALAKNAIRTLLPPNIKIISGPGCPVCVTAQGEIQAAINLASKEDVIIATFGDMVKIPGKKKSLSDFKNVKLIYSPLDALKIAIKNPNKEIILLGIGFETTTPLIAATILQASKQKLNNFSVLPMHKTVPVALEAILDDPDSKIKGLILPGHVAAITGRAYFDFIKKYNVSGVVAGFDALDIMECIYMLVKLHNDNKTDVINNYKKIVSEKGNTTAWSTMLEIFEPSNANWRGIGNISQSGLTIKSAYKQFNALEKFNLQIEDIPEPEGCLCGKILTGKVVPTDCGYFKNGCTPSTPIGPCMVSSEGTCAAHYKYYN